MHKNEHSLKNVNSYPRQLVEKSFSAKYSTRLIYMLCVLYSKCLIGFIVVFVQSLLAKGPICLFHLPKRQIIRTTRWLYAVHSNCQGKHWNKRIRLLSTEFFFSNYRNIMASTCFFSLSLLSLPWWFIRAILFKIVWELFTKHNL